MKEAAEATGRTISELSSMRWLAELYPQLPNLRVEFPQCTSFERFKRLVPSLRETAGHKGSGRRRHSALRKSIAAARRLLARLHEVADPHDDDELTAFRDVVGEVNDLIADRFGGATQRQDT